MARILIVEDEQVTASDLRETLIGLGHAVVGVTASGREAIELAQQTTPDLVLMDIYLESDVNGIAATQEIYQRLQIPVVYLTAYTDESTLQSALQTYPFGYLSKPWQDSLLNISIEVTLRRSQMEKTMLTQASELARMLDSLPDAAIATDEAGKITRMNPTAEVLTGWSRSDAIGLPVEQVLKLIHPQTREPVENPLLRAMQENQCVSIAHPCLLLTKSGHEVAIGDRAAPIYGNDGAIQGSVAVIQQIEQSSSAAQLPSQLPAKAIQLHQAIACMRGLRRVLARLNECTNFQRWLQIVLTEIGIAIAAEYGWISLVSSGYNTATVTADYVGENYGGITLTIGSQLPLDQVTIYYSQLESLVYWLAPNPRELPRPYQSIVTDPAHVAIFPLKENRHLLGEIGLCCSSPWTVLEAEFMAQVIQQCSLLWEQHATRLQSSRDSGSHPIDPTTATGITNVTDAWSLEGHNSLRSIHTLVATIRQLVASLRSMANVAWQGAPERQRLWQEMEQYLEVLYVEWQQELHLWEALRIGQVDESPPHLAADRLNLSDWLPAVIAPVVSQAARRQQTVHYQIADNMSPIAIQADSLKHIVTELLTNASKHSPIGARITLSARIISQHLELQITNTGVKIPEREIRRIFEPFYRVQSSVAGTTDGLGLGLTLVKKLVTQLNGDIKITTPRLNETSVVVIFPVGGASDSHSYY
ncbi:MAG: response regulator [Cyanobacteria bacterium]|nr:response regulator [Cyanobacteriota bacterium]MDW8202638.1 response regulator [Cyanobacteriota bacterium SKYGB_h_bin112]